MRLPPRGLIAATFTPMKPGGAVDLDRIPAVAQRLSASGIRGIFLCGTTGEGESLSCEERRAVSEAYIAALEGRLPAIVQVGHNSLREAQALAAHAQRAGAAGIAATPPSYFKPASVEAAAEWLAEVSAAAPALPVYYYHIPGLTGFRPPMGALLAALGRRVARMAGVKFSSVDILDLQACVEASAGSWDVFYGTDEQLLTGLCAGATGAVGSTYNFAAPLYLALLAAAEAGDLEESSRLQRASTAMIAAISRHGGVSALKAVMAIAGMSCGPPRLPLAPLGAAESERLRADLEAVGALEWIRPG
jgi:N-acetylneuraminate lyase